MEADNLTTHLDVPCEWRIKVLKKDRTLQSNPTLRIKGGLDSVIQLKSSSGQP